MITCRNYFRFFILYFYPFKIQSLSSKHKLHLFDPPVFEIDCFITDQAMSKSCLVSKYILKFPYHLSTFRGRNI